MKRRPTVVKSQYLIENESVVGLTSFPINVNGSLKAVNVILQGVGADMFINVEINYAGQNTQVAIIPGKYLKSNFSLSWDGDIPVDTETKLTFEHVQGSGEDQLIELTAVIETE